MQRIRVGIIGLGRSGRDIHGVYLATDKRFQIVAAADFIAERRQRAVTEYGCAVHDDHRDLLKRKDLDLVVNASFSHMHVPITLEGLKAGHHVLCEKPFASRARDVDRMIAAARKARRVLAVFQQSRFALPFQQILKVIRSGTLGRIVQVTIAYNGWSRRWDWQTLTEYNGGSLLNTGPHPLDQALVLFGEGQPKVTCFMDRSEGSFGDAENHVKVILSGPGHPLIDLEVSSCCAYPSATYNVYGTRGGMKATSGGAEWRFIKWSESPKHKVTTVPLRQADGTPSYPVEPLEWHNDAWPKAAPDGEKKAGYSAASAATSNLTEAYYNRLYKTLTRGVALEVTPPQVRRQIAVIEECRRQNPQIYRRKK